MKKLKKIVFFWNCTDDEIKNINKCFCRLKSKHINYLKRFVLKVVVTTLMTLV